jgi:large conductance mechanosensitive channel
MKGFTKFIQEQGVVGLAVGFILGGAVSAFVADFANGIVNPIVAAIFSSESLASNSLNVGDATLEWGAVVASLINFAIIAGVVYWGVKGLGLDKLDKEKE